MPVPWAPGQLLQGDSFQEGRFGQSLPSGSGFPEAAGKPKVPGGELGTLWDPRVSTVLDDFVNGLLPSA